MHSQLPKTNSSIPMPEVKEPKTDKAEKEFIEILAETVSYLIAYGTGLNLSINEKTNQLNKIHKSLERYRNRKS